MTPFFVIVAVHFDDYQRDQLHVAVKHFAKAWWHQHPDVWIVGGGDDPLWWRIRLGAIAAHRPTTILIFELPPEGLRRWDAFGAKHLWAWFVKEYAQSSGATADPAYEVPAAPDEAS